MQVTRAVKAMRNEFRIALLSLGVATKVDDVMDEGRGERREAPRVARDAEAGTLSHAKADLSACHE